MVLGSGIRKKSIPDPGSRGQKGTGSLIRIRNTGLDVTSFADPHPGILAEKQSGYDLNPGVWWPKNYKNRQLEKIKFFWS